MLIRFRGKQEGGHVRTRVFVGGSRDQTLANAGTLMLDTWQWTMLRQGLHGDIDHGVDVEFIDEDQEKDNANLRQKASR